MTTTETEQIPVRLDFDAAAPAFSRALSHLDNAATKQLDAVDFDHRLRELNVEYASKRNSGRIDSMRLTLVPNGTLASMNSICVHDSQFKQIYLRSEIDYHRRYPHIGQIYSAGATSQEESRTSVATANFT